MGDVFKSRFHCYKTAEVYFLTSILITFLVKRVKGGERRANR